MTTLPYYAEPESAYPSTDLVPHQQGSTAAEQDTLLRPNPSFPGDDADE